jgi:plasmid stabilization system protein ParE
MKRVVYHRLAANELWKSADFYEKRRPFWGDVFVAAVEVTWAIAQKHPLLGRPEAHGARSLRVKRFPFRVVYLDQSDRLWIVAVAHQSRRPGYWTRRLQ